MQQPSCHEGPPVGPLIAKHRCLLHLTSGHKFTTSRAFCYPVDTGFFITASLDHYVKLWDTNSTQVVMEYKMPAKVYGMPMSAIAITQTLIGSLLLALQVSRSACAILHLVLSLILCLVIEME